MPIIKLEKTITAAASPLQTSCVTHSRATIETAAKTKIFGHIACVAA